MCIRDRKRYFSSGEDLSVWPLEIKGKEINLGIQICEDLWDDDYDIKVSSKQKNQNNKYNHPHRQQQLKSHQRLIHLAHQLNYNIKTEF